jgi:hypothetical protein
MVHIKITSLKSLVIGTGAHSIFTALSHHTHLQCSLSHNTVIIYCNKNFRTTFEVQILLQNLYMFLVVENK